MYAMRLLSYPAEGIPETALGSQETAHDPRCNILRCSIYSRPAYSVSSKSKSCSNFIKTAKLPSSNEPSHAQAVS